MRKSIALLLCLAMVLSLCACGKAAPAPTTAATAAPTTAPTEAPDPLAVYTQAVTQTEAKTSLTLEITETIEKSVGTDLFLEETAQTVRLQDLHADTFAGYAYGSCNMGPRFIALEQTYVGGTLYSRINADQFSAVLTPQEFLGQFAGPVDAALYGSVVFTDDRTIAFSEASQPEAWIAEEYTDLISAEATVTLEEDGDIAGSTYHAVYTEGAARIDHSLSVTLSEEPFDPIAAPAAEEYPALEAWEAPLMMQKALGYLDQAHSVTSTTQELTSVAVAAETYTGAMTLSVYEDGALFSLDSTGNAANAQTGETYQDHYTESFRDGTITVTSNGETETIPDVTWNAIRPSVMETLFTLLPQDLSGTPQLVMEESKDAYILTYQPDQGDRVAEATIKSYTNEEYHEQLTAEISTATCVGTLGIDRYTGLPIGASLSYVGSHTFEGQEFPVATSRFQSLRLGTTAAYENITGELLPSEAPENPAQPLLYHVTSPQGGQMWMMGTIHVGDSRTQHLPQKVYDALDGSDALAVEFDINEMMEQMENDPQAAAAVAIYFMYLDGTTALDHVQDQELITQLISLTMANGTYNNNLLLMKPVLLEQMVGQYYMECDGLIQPAYGVDGLLLDRAKEAGMEIRNVESMDYQLAMLSGFSDALQEEMLKETLDAGMNDYLKDLNRLFELWCQGDEAALREVINEETSDSPEAQELDQKVMQERNAAMLDTCLEYLNSEDTVFFAVGLGHLLDDQSGLVDALREAGCTVEPVVY